MMCEAGWGHTVTGTHAAFLLACKRKSRVGACVVAAMMAFDTTTGALASADHIMNNSRWGHAPNNAYGNAVNHVEWSGLDLAWKYTALHNRGLGRLHVKN